MNNNCYNRDCPWRSNGSSKPDHCACWACQRRYSGDEPESITTDHTLPVRLDPGAYMPERAHSLDAGLDLRTPVDIVIHKNETEIIDTGVHVQIPTGAVGIIKSKSGRDIQAEVIEDGVIDGKHRKSIAIKMYNHGENDARIMKGRIIAKLVILPVLRPELELVDELEETERGDKGFGSTGR